MKFCNGHPPSSSSRPGRSRLENVEKIVEINYLIIMLVELIDNNEIDNNINT